MSDMNFQQMYERAVMKNNSLLCVGLEPEYEKLPMAIKEKEMPLYEFNKAIIDETVNHVCAFKFNSAFYEADGDLGVAQLKKTCDYIKNSFSDIPLILDAKRGDIGHTNEAYVKYAYDYLGVDAITLHPYLGKESLAPFLNITNKGNFILCRTSNPGAGEIQDLSIGQDTLYQVIATKVAGEWNQNGNCMLVTGAPFPQEIAEIRKLVGQDMLLLLPGVGSQGADLEKAVRAGINSKRTGIIVNASRSIMYASTDSNFFIKAREEAIKLKDEINKYRALEPIKVEEASDDVNNSVTQQDQSIQQTQGTQTNEQQEKSSQEQGEKKPEEFNPADLTE